MKYIVIIILLFSKSLIGQNINQGDDIFGRDSTKIETKSTYISDEDKIKTSDYLKKKNQYETLIKKGKSVIKKAETVVKKYTFKRYGQSHFRIEDFSNSDRKLFESYSKEVDKIYDDILEILYNDTYFIILYNKDVNDDRMLDLSNFSKARQNYFGTNFDLN